MSRPPAQPKRADIDPVDLEPYEQVMARMRRMAGDRAPEGDDMPVGEYFGALLNSPPLCSIVSQMGTFVRTAGNRSNTYTHADREFVDQVLSNDWDTNVVMGVHIPGAVGAGVRLEAVAGLHRGDESALNEDEQLLTRYIRQVVSGEVDDESFDAMQQRLGTRGVVEYTTFILWLQLTIRLMQ